MASDVNITSGAVDVVAQLNVGESYKKISAQLQEIAKRINGDNNFKLNIGASVSGINKSIKEAVNRQISVVQGEITPLDIKVQSESAKVVSAEIDKLVSSLKQKGMTDFKLSYSGDDAGNIRKATVEYESLADGIKKVIQQQYVLRDITDKGNIIGQVWEEGSKVVAKYTQGQDEAKAKAQATKAIIAELAAEITAVNKAMAQSELEFARGNRNASDLYFNDAAEKELQIRQKIHALRQSSVITIGEAEQKERELGEAIKNSSEKAEIFNAKLADKQYNQDFKNLAEERIAEEARIAEEISRSERLAVAYREASWKEALAEREAEEKRVAEERIAEERRVAEEIARNERLKASNYEAVWKEALAEREAEEKRVAEVHKQSEANKREAQQYVTKELLDRVQDYVNLLKAASNYEAQNDMSKAGIYRAEALRRNAIIQADINRLLEEGTLTEIQAAAIQREKVDSVENAAKAAAEYNEELKRSRQNQARNISPVDEQEQQKIFDTIERLKQARESLISDAQNIISKNGLSESSAAFKEIQEIITTLGSNTHLTSEEIAILKDRLKTIGEGLSPNPVLGVFGQIEGFTKNLLAIAGVYSGVMMARRAVRTMIANVRELDSAMTQLQIVTGKTSGQIESFSVQAIDAAKRIGVATTDVMKSVETYARLGYTLEDSLNLAEYTNMYANIAATDADSATDAITAILKGYQLEGHQVEYVTDMLTEVGQKYAVSAAELGIALQSGGASLQAAGNTLEESVALVAAGNAAIQDASKVGNALKTTSMRIRGATTELEDAGEDVDEFVTSTAKLRDLIEQISGVDIMIDDNTFKSTYQIMTELAKVWDDISDINQASLLEALAGKRNATVVQSIITNIKDLEGAYESATNSAGATARANEIYLESINGKLAQLKTTFVDLSTEIVNSDFAKNLIDIARGFLEVINQVTDALGPLFTIATGAALKKLYGGFKEVVKAGALTLTAFKPALIAAGIALVAAAVYGLTHGFERAKKKADELFSEFNTENEDTKDINSEISSISEKLEEMYSLREQGGQYDEAEISALEAQNEALRTKLELLEKANKLTAAEAKAALEEEIRLEGNKKQYAAKGVSGYYSYNPAGISMLTEDEYKSYALAELEKYANRAWLLEEDIDKINELTGNLALIGANYLEYAEEFRTLGLIEDAEHYEQLATEINNATSIDRFYDGISKTRRDDISDWVKSLGSLAEGLGVDEDTLTVSSLLDEEGASYTKLKAKADEYGISVSDLVGYLVDLGLVTEDVTVENTELTNTLESVLSGLSSETDILTEAIKALSSGKSIDEALTSEQITELIQKFPQLTDELRKYDAGLMSAEQLQNEFNTALRQFRGDQFIQALNDIVSAAEDYGRESSNVVEAVEELDDILPGLSATLLDENGVLTDNAIAALSSADALYECIAANKGLAVASAQMDLSNAVQQLEAVRSSALDSSIAMQIAMDQYYAAKSAADKAAEQYKSDLDDLLKRFSRSSSASSSSASSLPSAYEKAVKELDHLRAMDLISEEEYYRRLEALADKYLKGKSKYLDEYRSVQEKLWAYQKELYERQRDAEIEAAENRADAQKKALEDQYDAEKEALEKRKDLLEDEKDAYKDLIDYKKDLLDDASDERAHDQRVAELNQDIAQIEAELAALALDNSAKANARRVELHDELMAKQKELEEEQWDWSVDNQKDALDKEYERYEKTIDAQIKLLEDQLDALEKSYDAQLDHIDSMLEANINAINSSFDALINRAADAAAQIQAIFASIDVSTSSGITGLQQGLVNSGYDIGNYGANKDGVDGVMGKMTTKGLQQYLNDLQNSGVINFGDDLKIDGKVGSKTRKAIDAAIAAGYLNASFDKLHTGGIVGQKSSRNDLDIIKELVPLDDNEVWAKLLKKEMVLTEGQQEAVREAFRSIAAIKSATNTDVSKSRTLAGSVVQNNSPVFTIHNVFEGDVDADTLRRLDEWGNKFKKDVQNGVFKTMNQQNKFAGKTPVKTI